MNRVKHEQGNAESDNYNTLLSNGNEFVSQDAVEEANIKVRQSGGSGAASPRILTLRPDKTAQRAV